MPMYVLYIEEWVKFSWENLVWTKNV